ncbi:MAG: carbohydrate kinase [Methylophilaceae bacterium]
MITKNSNQLTNTVALFGEVLADVFPDKTVLGGAPYNVARHLRAFALNPILITRTGNDQLREQFLTEFAKLEMDHSGVQCDTIYPTGQVNVQMQNGAHTFDILPDQAYDHIDAELTHVAIMSARPNLVYFGTLAQRAEESRLALDTFLNDAKGRNEAKPPRFLDVNLRHPWYNKQLISHSLQRADIVKVNEEELSVIGQMFSAPEASGKPCGIFLMQKFGFKLLLVTCGGAGAWALTNGGVEANTAGQNIGSELVDTVGAGDGFSAVCILGIVQKWPILQMLSRANAFAAELCKVRGAAPASAEFYLPFLKDWS